MISELSKKISSYLVLNGADESEASVLAYGAECFINLLISDGLLLIIGLLTHRVIYLLIWSVSFILLRVNLGGLHASSHFWCILIGTAIGASSMAISPLWVTHTNTAVICAVLAALIAIIIAPVPHKNKKHVQKQRRKIKLMVAVTVSAEGIAVLTFYSVNPLISAYIVSGLVIATALAVAGLFFNPR